MSNPKCKCGCKETVTKPYNKYIVGHNHRMSDVDYEENLNGCWIWQRSKKNGYGAMIHPEKGITCRAHRYYYEKYKGPIGAGLVIDHLCGVRACVNPKHLEAVVQRTNVKYSWITIDVVNKIIELYEKGQSPVAIIESMRKLDNE